MIEVLSLAEEDTQLHKAAVNEMAGPCPLCGGNDRFRVRHFRDTGVWKWMCRSCYDAGQFLPNKGKKRGWGDEIDYLRHIRGKSYQEAAALVRGQDSPPAYTPTQARYQSPDWQEQAQAAMQEHYARLWSDDTLALSYGHSRGFYDHIIKQFQLGYSVYQGIPYLVIPSINDGQYVTIYRRDLRPDVPHNERWKDAPGGAKDELYLADYLTLDPNKPVVLCEDALSALSVYQECGDIVNVVATGGVKCCLKAKWIARLLCMPRVLIALDADPQGDEQSKEWLKRLKNASRLRPVLKDANDMLMDGWDVRAWVLNALQQEQAQASEQEEEAFLCSVCGMDGNTAPDEVIFEIDEYGAYCPGCFGKRQPPAAHEETSEEADARWKREALADTMERMEHGYREKREQQRREVFYV